MDRLSLYFQTMGFDFSATWFNSLSFSTSIQYTWLDIDGSEAAIRGTYFKEIRLYKDRVEMVPGLSLKAPILKKYKTTAYITGIDEYFYDIEHGVPLRNEIGVGFLVALNDRVALGGGWRHVDWVKDFDSDQIETSITVKF